MKATKILTIATGLSMAIAAAAPALAQENVRPVRPAQENVRPVRPAQENVRPVRPAQENVRPVRPA